MTTYVEPISIEAAARTGRRLTYTEYLRTPDTNLRYEILDGVVRMSPSGTSDHQWIAFTLAKMLDSFVTQHQLGVVLMAPLDIVIRTEPLLKTRQPDVLYLSAERTGIHGRRGLRQMPRIEVAPEIAVEILSPSETRATLQDKLTDYAQIGVPEVWVVSPEGETVEVLHLANQNYQRAGLYGAGDTLLSPVLPAFTLAMDLLFAD